MVVVLVVKLKRVKAVGSECAFWREEEEVLRSVPAFRSRGGFGVVVVGMVVVVVCCGRGGGEGGGLLSLSSSSDNTMGSLSWSFLV